MLFIFVYFVRGGFRTKFHAYECDATVSFAFFKDQRLYENFMHTKGPRSPTYEYLVRTKYSGFTVRTSLSELNHGHVSAFSPHSHVAACDPLESLPLIILAMPSIVACRCQLSKITTLACAVTMLKTNNKIRVMLLPIAWDSESCTFDLADRARCVKITGLNWVLAQPWTRYGFGSYQ